MKDAPKIPIHPKYTAFDIIKYHNGELTHQEMHDMELAALSDAMLSDAIDGFSNQNMLAEKFTALKASMNSSISIRNNKRKKSILFTLSIAASFICILFSGYYFLQHQSDEVKVLAKAEYNQPKQPTVFKELPHSTDKIIQPNTQQVKGVTTESVKNDKIVVEKVEDNNNMVFAVDSKPQLDLPIVQHDEIREPAVVIQPAMEQSSSTREERVVNENDLAKDNIESAHIASSKANSNQVVFTPETVSKKKLYKSDDEAIKTSQSYPVVGWADFEQYILSNKRAQTENTKEMKSGVVVLTFKIDQSGKPKSIKVKQSLSDSFDKESVRLIKEGPLWEKADNNKVTVSIKF
jgi:outer membrane biosynthesis protein TonB